MMIHEMLGPEQSESRIFRYPSVQQTFCVSTCAKLRTAEIGMASPCLGKSSVVMQEMGLDTFGEASVKLGFVFATKTSSGHFALPKK